MSALDDLRGLLRDPVAFASAIPGYQGDKWGRKCYGTFHRQLTAEIRSANRVSIAVPRNHAKTTLFSQILTAWELCMDPEGHHRILSASATLGLARENCGKVREILEGSLVIDGHTFPLARLFPHVRPVNPHGSAGPCPSFNIAGRSGPGKEPSVFTGSPGTSLAGRRFTGAVLDDIVNEQNSYTREQREKVIAFIAQVEALAYDMEHSWIRNPCTPWSPGDATDHLAQRRGWVQIRHDIYLDGDPRRSEPGERRPVVCPSFINEEEANEMEMTAIEAGRYAFFSAQYRLKPISSDAPLFTAESYAHASRNRLTLDVVRDLGPAILLWDPVATVDEKSTSSIDRNGIAVVRAIPAPRLPVDVPDARRNIFVPIFIGEIAGGADEALRQVEAWSSEQRWSNWPEIWIEQVAAQTFLAPWARDRGQIQGRRVRGQPIPAKSLTLRLSGLQTAMREGYFQIPVDLEGGDLLRKRLLEYPRSDYDDVPAALCLLSYWWERHGPVDEAPAAQPLPRETSVWVPQGGSREDMIL